MKKYNIKVSQFTRIAFYMGCLAVGIQLFLGFRHINDPDLYGQQFAQICLLEATFGIVGLLSIDLISGTFTNFYPKNFKRIGSDTLFFMGVALVAILITQIITQTTLTIEDSEMALGILFCSISEELFFRGVMMAVFLRIGSYTKKIKISKKLEISPITIAGIILQGCFFGLLHTNYYTQPDILTAMIISGIILGFIVWATRDLTAVILAHFLLNFICVWQTYWVFTL